MTLYSWVRKPYRTDEQTDRRTATHKGGRVR